MAGGIPYYDILIFLQLSLLYIYIYIYIYIRKKEKLLYLFYKFHFISFPRSASWFLCIYFPIAFSFLANFELIKI